MDLKDAIYGRRSVRKYTDQPISDEDIKEIMEAGTMAPSGMNMQPWHFVAIKNPDAINELKGFMAAGVDAFVPHLEKRFPTHPEVVKETAGFIETLGCATFCVLAFIRKPDYDKSISTITQSVAAAIENMLLTAYSKGIGSCWLTAPNEVGATPAIHERFAPDKGDFVALITFGYPAIEPKAPRRHNDDRIEYIF